MTTSLEIKEKRYSVEEWLALERRSDIRHEYVYGKLIPMAGEAKRANKIAKNLVKLMDDPLYERGFDTFTHDVKAEVVPDGIYRYPDFVVAPLVDDEDDYIVKHAVLMAEVASEESNNRDRVKKRKEYHNIPTLWYYLIISQDEMLIEFHTRDQSQHWQTQYFTEPTDVIELERFGIKLTLSDIYDRIRLEQ